MSRPQSRGVNEKFDLHGEEAIGPRAAWPFSGRSRKVSVAFAQTLRHCVNIANASAPRSSKKEIFFFFWKKNWQT